MSFEEAYQKGKFIKRADWPDFISKTKVVYALETWCVPPEAFIIKKEDVHATDWEIKNV